jgi:cell division protein FtsL
VNDIGKLIAKKEAAIAQLKDEIKALERAKKIVAGVSSASGSTSGRRRAKSKRSAKTGRAPRGAKKAKVLGVMNATPQRMRDIAGKAGVSTQEAASVLQSAVKRGEVGKGRQRGTYRLAKK